MRCFILLASLFVIAQLSSIASADDPCWIAYQTDQTGDWEIFLWQAGQSEDLNLSLASGANRHDLAPTRSPDGQGFVFMSSRTGTWELYLAHVDGSPPQRLTENESALELDPVFAPDGQHVVYDTDIDGNWELHLLDLQTGENQRLTDHPANDVNAAWSPDGKNLLFQSDREGLWQIFRLDLSTLSVTRLSDGLGADFDPLYSPDGSRIAFRSVRDDPTGENSTVHIMDADGGNMRYISTIGNHALNHMWSADSQHLAYQADQGQNRIFDIYVYDLARGQNRLITANIGDFAAISDESPAWDCNSQHLIFSSSLTGNPDLFIAPAFGDNPLQLDREAQQITFSPAVERDPLGGSSDENASRREALPPPNR